MGILPKEAYERKKAWAARRMIKNAEITTLTAEQHETLAWLCGLRHEIHCGWDSMWNVESGDYNRLWGGYDEINNRLSGCGLKVIDSLPDRLYIPDSMSFDYLLSDEEKMSWDQRAEKFNHDNPNSLYKHTGYSLWMEESGDYSTYLDQMNRINYLIETYLASIDEEHGTDYRPSGATRGLDNL